MDVSPLQVIGYLQDQLNRLYEASETGPIDWLELVAKPLLGPLESMA